MRRSNIVLLAGGLAAALLVVVLLAPNASSSPDGLERVAEDQGFAGEAVEAPDGLLSGYAVAGVADERASTILAGAIGVAVVTAVTLLAARLLRPRSDGGDEPDDAAAPAGPR